MKLKSIGLFLILLLFSACTLQEKKAEDRENRENSLLPQNYAEVGIKNVRLDFTRGVVLLQKKNSNLTLEFYVSREQGELILAAFHNASFSRPMAHDLLFKILKEARMKLLYVSVDRLESGTYYASLLIETAEGGRIQLDARPSDAIVISLKSRAPIYVDKNLMSAGEMHEEDVFKGREA